MAFDVSAIAVAASFTAGWAMIHSLSARADAVFQALVALALGLTAALALALALRLDAQSPARPPPSPSTLGTGWP